MKQTTGKVSLAHRVESHSVGAREILAVVCMIPFISDRLEVVADN